MRGTIAGELLNQDNSTIVNQAISSLVNAYIRDNCSEVNPLFYTQFGIDSAAEPSKYNISLKDIESYVENSLSTEQKGANGIVFTPDYIIQYILDNISLKESSKIIDPSCGCGSFLVEAVKVMSREQKKTYRYTIENNIYGLDIVPRFIETARLILALLCLSNGEDPVEMKTNLICVNSLNSDWKALFEVDGFDAIIGNPPYSNPHDLDESMTKFIKTNYKSTKSGTSNIYYAFIEKSLDNISPDGNLGFIIPNNYLSIKAAKTLRKILKDSHMIKKIIDFNDNMIFAPVRTYNSLLFLENSKREYLEYSIIETTDDVQASLKKCSFNTLYFKDMDDAGWKLLTREEAEIIHKIERFDKSIKKYIHTGIATLRDDLYIVDSYDAESGCYLKEHNGKSYLIEHSIVRNLYKISDIETEKDVQNALKHIICPYKTTLQTKLDGSSSKVSKLIPESTMKNNYPLCYEYFCAIKDELNKRDAGKGAGPIWYAYGRTQSLNYIGRKLLFPTFSHKPKFMMLDDEEALFCNGYVIVEDSDIPLELLQKIINSDIMDYYVSSTSYPIEGGYYCYQKQFIQNFSIPPLVEGGDGYYHEFRSSSS